MDEVVVTAMKKTTVISIQDVPTAVTAFDNVQLENRHVTSLGDLGYSVPNVSLDDIGTFPGYANFSIRGLGINSSIPSIDPTVGVFVDGMYLGISGGVLFDNFDLQSIEILRGPQGLLFGRNVTGGAILLNTTVPGDELQANGRFALESGTKKITSGVLSGPVINDLLNAKIAAYYSDDSGWFENTHTGDRHGRSETKIIRHALNAYPLDGLQMILKLELGQMEGDGPANQNRDIAALGEFDIQIDEPGYSDVDWKSAVSESNINIALGDGVLTNVFAWRQYEAGTLSDIDSSPIIGAHAETWTDQEQFSNELRYSGTFNLVDVTAGIYYFTQNIDYIEDRLVNTGALRLTGGGDQTYKTLGFFASTDWHLSENWLLNAGIRFTHEEKEAALADLVPSGCSLMRQSCNVTFNDNEEWKAYTPKFGFQWVPDDDTQVYAFWTRGFRSGGYNFRNNDTTIPGPFDPEKQDAYEVGVKKDFSNTTRVNLSAFYNEIHDLQREISFIGQDNVTFQTITNAADAQILGVELESQVYLSNKISFTGHIGYMDDKYTHIFYDLNEDGEINSFDKKLSLPRLAPWSYGASVIYSQDIGSIGIFSGSVAFNHRDRQFYDDNNRGVLSAADMLEVNLSIEPADGGWKFSLYGRNLLNEVTEGLNTSMPIYSQESTFTILNKGRIFGTEFVVNI
ncbi:TonB-dependent receptor [Microbulbifer sp. MLAF003]|uniref:TonB-dependent receptor n=1 Tax=unclassified Microbulbifer TaxID=2619833 RepID=UPI0024AE1304|nr:TonB-dependent receptor [Microbulbifer sp. MLAF003]WHI52290.1 TonB-dependent receptor [Microbulbifer sp. MLAF003]